MTDESSASPPPSSADERPADWSGLPYSTSCTVQTSLQTNREKYHERNALPEEAGVAMEETTSFHWLNCNNQVRLLITRYISHTFVNGYGSIIRVKAHGRTRF